MFNILRQKNLVTIVLLLVSVSAIAQQYSRQKFQPEYDAKKVRFGYFLGIAGSNYNVKYNNYFLTPNNTDFFNVNSKRTFGLKMGGLVNFNVNAHFDVRVLPTVAIYSRQLNINDSTELTFKQSDKAWFELPVMLKYKSIRRGNTRMYMFGGMRLGLETNALNLAQKGRLNASIYSTRSSDFSIEYGAGLEVFQRFFKLSPEIHFSHGLVNLKDNSLQNTTTALGVVDKLKSHTVTFYLIFE